MSAAARARAPRSRSLFSEVPMRRHVIDLAVLLVLFVLALVGFQPVYGGAQYLVTGVLGILLGMLIAVIGAQWRWGPLRITALLIGVYLLLGAMVAAPTHALWGVVPTPAALLELLRAPVATWKSVLTVAPPVGTAQGVLGVVWISTLLLSLLGSTIVLRTRAVVAAWLFPIALLAVTIVFGTTEAFAPVIRAVPFAILSVAWLTWRFESDRLAGARSTIISDSTGTVSPGSWRNPVLRRRVVGGAVILALAGGVAIGAQSLLDPPEGAGRTALRDEITPPFDPRKYVSPLAEFRGYYKSQRDTELFSATGLAGGEYVRLASLDRYDAQVYNVASSTSRNSASGAFVRTASGVDLHEGTSAQATSTVTIGAYTGVWMPTVGSRTDRIDLGDLTPSREGDVAENLFLNERSGTAVNASGMVTGDTYTLSYEPYTPPTAEDRRSAKFADVELPENPELDPRIRELAEDWAGTSASDYERFANLSRQIKADAFYSHGVDDDDAASPSGHGVMRLQDMLEDPSFEEGKADARPKGPIGDEEQFAALTAVMAREIGIPARVVMGFQVPEDASGTVSITGEDVTAWVEVDFEKLGWVRFDPAPEEDEDPTQPQPKEVDKPLPQVAQPPPPPAEPPSPPPGAMSDDADDEEDEQDETLSWGVYVLLGVSPFLLIGLVLTSIVVAKVVRRRRRRNRDSLPARVDGGWQEILDQVTDLGTRPDPRMTRQEIAVTLDAAAMPAAAPGAAGPGGTGTGVGARALAATADRVVFGPDDVPAAVVDAYWDGVQGTRRALVAAAPRRRRLRALFSLRSFRRGPRETALERRSERARVRARAAADRRGAELRRRRAAPGSRPATGGGALTPQNLLPAVRGFLSRLAGRIPRAPRKGDRR